MAEFYFSKQPVIYELNTPVFLNALCKKYSRRIMLDSIPDEEWEALAALPVNAVWLMGVWERSAYSKEASIKNKAVRSTLDDFTEKDVIGSAYSIGDYEVDKSLGGKEGLAHARTALHRHGLGLILDFVPNHIACDHEWATRHPEYLVSGSEKDLKASPKSFFKTKHEIIARGRDPLFPAWEDVLQINAFSPEARKALGETLAKIAKQCDGVRCDMAMLVTNDVFGKTWEEYVGRAPETEFWADVLKPARSANRNAIFIAEVYWNWERRLLTQGFDYCYDKALYDALVQPEGLGLYHHIHSDPVYQSRLLRFLENHDEPRAVKVFKGPKYHAAIFTLATLPGAQLYHEGQLEGFQYKIPVHLARGPEEKIDEGMYMYYKSIIGVIANMKMRNGTWQLCKGNNGLLRSTKLIAWIWTFESIKFMCIVNYGHDSECGRFELEPGMHSLPDIVLGQELLSAKGLQVHERQLAVGLIPWGYMLLRFSK